MKSAVLIIGMVCLLLAAVHAAAQGVGQQRPSFSAHAATIEELVVRERAALGSSTAATAEQARAALKRIPGAIGFVEAEDFSDQFTQSIGDMLELTPGVFADTSAQRETRISIRGSGLSSGFERRGLSLYRDGVPITRASGSTEFQEVDPLSVAYAEVYKGANGGHYGGTSLGGAVNLVTPTGRTLPSGPALRIEGGSFGTLRGHLRQAWAGDVHDGYVGITGWRSAGYRDQSDVESVYGFANFGLQIGEGLETRFYLTALSDHFELAGSSSLQDALEDPRSAARPVTVGPFFPGGPVTVLDPGPVVDDWDRNLDVLRVANRTVLEFDRTTLEGGLWYARRELDHAITRFAGVIDQSEDEYGIFARATSDTQLFDRSLQTTIGLIANRGDNDARRWANEFGSRGILTQRSRQVSRNVQVYGQGQLQLTEQLSFVAALQFAQVQRENEARLNDVSGSERYTQWNPRLGLIHSFADDWQVFANVSRDFEPPSLADLTAGGVLDFTPLAAQKSWTVEVGSRGQRRRVAWDLAVYQSWIDGELIKFGLPGAFGFVSFTDNADDTVHRGIEIGMDWSLETTAMTERGLSLSWRHNWTVNDFSFDGDASFGDGRLAGVPRNVYVSELRLESSAGWYLGAQARWVPSGPWVDFANTVRAPGYDVYGLRAGWRFANAVTVFASVENLFDERYISNVATNADQSLQNGRLFTPGQGRSVYAGLSWNL